MGKGKIGAIALLAILSGSGFGKIVQIQKMAEILPTIGTRTLVVFDLDNTIMEAKQSLGSDQWYEYLVDKYSAEAKQAGVEPAEAHKQAIHKAVAEWMPIQKITDVELVEKGTPDLIAGLQQRGLRTMGLTARPLELEATTLRHLQSVHVDLQAGAKDLPKELKGFEDKPNVGWYHGVLFVGLGNDKGETLTRFLKANNIEANHIVFVDDKARNIDSVERACSAYGYDCVNFRYGGADLRVKRFDPKIAEIQRELWGKILSDEDAQRISKK